MKRVLALIVGIFISPVYGAKLTTFSMPFFDLVQVRVGVQNPDGLVKGDILYFHGLGDRLDNHGPLFDEWNKAGFRVVAFDFPEHGETTGTIWGLNFMDLADIAVGVEEKTREDANRPLYMAGWSTGGLLAVRMVQDNSLSKLHRRPQAVVLIAPGISVRPLVGKGGWITQETLTRNPNPPHHGQIKPDSPFKVPSLASSILTNSELSRIEFYPENIPTLVVVAGDDTDYYVYSQSTIAWAKDAAAHGSKMEVVQFQNAYHELDNEPDPVGQNVRELSAQFFLSAKNRQFQQLLTVEER